MRGQSPVAETEAVATQHMSAIGSMWRRAHYDAARARLGAALRSAGEMALRQQIEQQRTDVARLHAEAAEAAREQQERWLAATQNLFLAGIAHVLGLPDARTIEPAIRPLLPSASDALAMAARDTGEVTESALADIATRTAMTAVVDVLPSLIESETELAEVSHA